MAFPSKGGGGGGGVNVGHVNWGLKFSKGKRPGEKARFCKLNAKLYDATVISKGLKLFKVMVITLEYV